MEGRVGLVGVETAEHTELTELASARDPSSGRLSPLRLIESDCYGPARLLW